MFAALLATILLVDELLTFGLSALLGRGGGAGAWILIVACLWSCRPRMTGGALSLIGIAIALLFGSIKELNATSLYLAVLTGLIVVVSASRLHVRLVGSKAFTRALEVVLAARMLSFLGFDFFERVAGVTTNRPTGLYSEPSHLAFYVGILYLLVLACRPLDRTRAGLYALVILATTFSATAIIPIIIILHNLTSRARRRKLMLLVAVTGMTAIFTFQWDYLLERVVFSSDEGNASLTAQVIVYYYGLLLTHLSTNPFSSFGPDGFRNAYLAYSGELGLMPDDINSADGSFLAVKLIVENGLPFFALFVGLVLSKVVRSRATAGGLLFFQYVLLRGFGLTSCFVIAMMVLLATTARQARPVCRRPTYGRAVRRSRSPRIHV